MSRRLTLPGKGCGDGHGEQLADDYVVVGGKVADVIPRRR